MPINFSYLSGTTRPRAGLLYGAAALLPLLGGCVATVAVPPPPRPTLVVEASPAYVTAEVAPPPLPVYEQPPLPEPGYLWTPGYWHYGAAGYFWVPGTWVQPPRVGVLWTPGYWGYGGGVYVFHAGYWGPHVGFYGGVNYGGGYVGNGYAGGRWVNNSIAYNTAVTNVNTTIVHNTYNETVINNTTVNRVSYNGGTGGLHAVATPTEAAAAAEPHVGPTQAQTQHFQAASQNRSLQASVNNGHPAIAATPHPGAFSGPGVVAAHPPGAHPYGNGPVPPAGPGSAGGYHAGQPGQPGAGYHPGQPVNTANQPAAATTAAGATHAATTPPAQTQAQAKPKKPKHPPANPDEPKHEEK
jgi:hypothetical protein